MQMETKEDEKKARNYIKSKDTYDYYNERHLIL